MLAAVDAVLGVPFYITYYCADVDSPKAQAAVMRDLYAKKYGSDYSMGDPKESESKIDSSRSIIMHHKVMHTEYVFVKVQYHLLKSIDKLRLRLCSKQRVYCLSGG